MKRLFLLLPLSLVGSIVLLVGAGMAGGACHCMTPMFTLFPYGSFAMEHLSWDYAGLLMILLQFPLYVVIVILVRGRRRKTVAVLLLVTLHAVAATLALRDYCQSRRTCSTGDFQHLVEPERRVRVL